MSDRITRYMQRAGGGRNVGLTVNGVKVMVEPSNEGEQAAAEALAERIAALGPADGPVPAEAPRAAPAEPLAVEPFRVGEGVWCKVRGAEGWSTVMEVRFVRSFQQIRISGYGSWCPAYNFTREQS